ncbi:hypothetical protein ACLKA6_002875 [Drosophila palustris]
MTVNHDRPDENVQLWTLSNSLEWADKAKLCLLQFPVRSSSQLPDKGWLMGKRGQTHLPVNDSQSSSSDFGGCFCAWPSK